LPQGLREVEDVELVDEEGVRVRGLGGITGRQIRGSLELLLELDGQDALKVRQTASTRVAVVEAEARSNQHTGLGTNELYGAGQVPGTASLNVYIL
jgi:hypothetical protein